MRRVLLWALFLTTTAWASGWEEDGLKITNGSLDPVIFELTPDKRVTLSPRNSLNLPATSVIFHLDKDCYGPLKIIVKEDDGEKELISLPMIAYNTEIFIDTLPKVNITPRHKEGPFPDWLIDEVQLDATKNLANSMARFREAHEKKTELPCSCLCSLLMEYETKVLKDDYQYCVNSSDIPSLIAAYKERHPNVKTSLSDDEIYEAEKALLEEGIKIHPHDPRLMAFMNVDVAQP